MTNLEWMAEVQPEIIADGLASLYEPCPYCAWSDGKCVGNGRKCWEGVLEWLRSERNDAEQMTRKDSDMGQTGHEANGTERGSS